MEDNAQEGSVEKEIESVNMIQYLPISERLMIISGEIEKDDTLQTLIKTIREGWSTNKRNVPNEIHRVHSAHLGVEGCLRRARYECPDKEIH